MKIIFVITNITNCAGTERVVTSIANYFVSLSHEVSIISLFSKQGKAYFPLNNAIKVIHLNSYPYTNKGLVSRIWGRFVSAIKFIKIIRKAPADVYIGTSVNTNVLLLLFNSSKKNIGCEHFAANVPMNTFFRIFRDAIYKNLNRLVVLTKRDFEYYNKKGIAVEIIPNSIPFVVRTNNSFKTNIALAVGRHTRQKSFDRLLYIWKNIENKRTDWELLIIGEGELYEYNQNVANTLGLKTVRFLPFQKDVQSYYQKASLYLMTSLYEALPMVLIEAKMCGCVCVSYDCKTGPAEIIKDGEDGCLIPEGNQNLFVEKVLNLMDDQVMMERMGAKAMINAEDYSPDKILPKWKQILNEVYECQ